MKTDKEIYDHCRANYYCGCDPEDDEEMYNQLCELYENWDEEEVEELIQNDVQAMKSFLRSD